MTREKQKLHSSSKRVNIQLEELQVGHPRFNLCENHEAHPLGKYYRPHKADDDGEKH